MSGSQGSQRLLYGNADQEPDGESSSSSESLASSSEKMDQDSGLSHNSEDLLASDEEQQQGHAHLYPEEGDHVRITDSKLNTSHEATVVGVSFFRNPNRVQVRLSTTVVYDNFQDPRYTWEQLSEAPYDADTTSGDDDGDSDYEWRRR